MNTSSSPGTGLAVKFVGHITHAIGDDRGARRALASGLGRWTDGQPPGPMHQYVAPWLPAGTGTGRQRAYYTVAALMSTADRSGTGSRVSIGTALGRASSRVSPTTTRHQLNRLVRPNPDGPYGDLRGAVRLIAEAGIALDWARLLTELDSWPRTGPATCTRWQQDYYRAVSQHDHERQ